LIGAYHVIAHAETVNVMFVFGFVMCIGAAFIQYVSDKQMMAFRLEHQGEKKSIDEGLWHYSRHPNYFGEVMMWWGMYVMYLGVTRTLDWQIVSPLLMTALFLFISIPMMEEKLMGRPGYERYCDEVSVLIPFPRKSSHHNKPEA
jgi:steroid 5-alpha reductase family enzyme